MKLLICFSLTISLLSGETQLVKNLKSGKPQRVVCYGTSLTAKGPWVEMLTNVLQKKFGSKVEVINSGGSGMDSNWGLANIKKKVIDQKPDTVFIEFGMNDAVVRFKNSKDKVRNNLESMIKQVQNALPACEIILMTMNPALGIPAGHRSARDDLNGYYDIYRDLAKKHNIKMLVGHIERFCASD